MRLNKKQHSQIKPDTARKTFLDNEYYSCDNKSYSQKINMLINIKHVVFARNTLERGTI